MWKIPVPARASVEEMCGLCLPRVLGLGPLAEKRDPPTPVGKKQNWVRSRLGDTLPDFGDPCPCVFSRDSVLTDISQMEGGSGRSVQQRGT